VLLTGLPALFPQLLKGLDCLANLAGKLGALVGLALGEGWRSAAQQQQSPDQR